jgi:ubiquinone/menaquinone biosynthesis C-methylase UbiE
MVQNDNYYVKDQISYTTSPQTRPGWKRRYDFALQHIGGGDAVLDCACGIGEGTYMISQRSRRAVGVDIDTHFIDYCRATYPGIEFVCHNLARRLPFDADQFNVVVSLETLEHLPSIDIVHTALDNFNRVLKSGGLLITSVPNSALASRPAPAQQLKLLALRLFGSMVKKQARWHEHFQFWDARQFERVLHKHFSMVSVFGVRFEGVTQDTDQAPYLLARAKKQ